MRASRAAPASCIMPVWAPMSAVMRLVGSMTQNFDGYRDYGLWLQSLRTCESRHCARHRACSIRVTIARRAEHLAHQELNPGDDDLNGDEHDDDHLQPQRSLGIDDVGKRLGGIGDHGELAGQ